MNKKDYKHIIWDWNGTLFNDVELCTGIMNTLLLQESLPAISLQRYKEIFTFPVIEYYKAAGHTFENNSFEILGKQFIDKYEKIKSTCDLFLEVRLLLKEFNQKNIRQYLLSAYEQESLNNIIKQYKINEYFELVVGLDNIYGDGKLNLGKKLIKQINLNGDGKNILLIGDTLHDFEVANEIGVDCILVSQGHQDKERLSKSGATVVNNLTELRQKLFGDSD
jgi:phosphoglycolate phosphatase